MNLNLLKSALTEFIAKVDPSYAKYHRLADKAASQVRRAFLKAIAALQGDITLRDVEEALRRGDLLGAENLINWGKLSEDLGDIGVLLYGVFEEAAQSAVGEFALEGTGLTYSFTLSNEEAERYIAEFTAQLITQVGDETKAAIRQIILEAFQEGGHPYQTARKIKDLIGLTDRYAKAVENYRAKLTAKGFSKDKIDRMVERYKNKLLKLRAETISRTETLRAANVGQQEMWEKAMEQGLIPSGTRRVWTTAKDERVCPWCGPLDGVQVGMRENFSITATAAKDKETGTFRTYTELTPPLHTQCRCSMRLEFD